MQSRSAGLRHTGGICSPDPERQHVDRWGDGAALLRPQDETITRKLDEGVRRIDLQVGYNGGGNPVSGWRVVQNLSSSSRLYEYLDEVANWAAGRPAEAFVEGTERLR